VRETPIPPRCIIIIIRLPLYYYLVLGLQTPRSSSSLFPFHVALIGFRLSLPLGFHPLCCIQPASVSPFSPYHDHKYCSFCTATFYSLLGCLRFVLSPPLCLIAAHLMTHSLNLTSGIRDLVVIGSVLFEYSLAGYLGSTGERKRREYGQEQGSFGFLFYEDFFLDFGSRLR